MIVRSGRKSNAAVVPSRPGRPGRTVKQFEPWSDADVAFLRAMIGDGARAVAVARRIGRSLVAVEAKMRRLGLRQAAACRPSPADADGPAGLLRGTMQRALDAGLEDIEDICGRALRKALGPALNRVAGDLAGKLTNDIAIGVIQELQVRWLPQLYRQPGDGLVPDRMERVSGAAFEAGCRKLAEDVQRFAAKRKADSAASAGGAQVCGNKKKK